MEDEPTPLPKPKVSAQSPQQQHKSLYSEHKASSNAPRKPKELVSQGISFLSGLAETLKSPEATAQLVDSIVVKDEHTGETSIKIPVQDKETVTNIFGLLGKILSSR